jgi:hypothetical protein
VYRFLVRSLGSELLSLIPAIYFVSIPIAVYRRMNTPELTSSLAPQLYHAPGSQQNKLASQLCVGYNAGDTHTYMYAHKTLHRYERLIRILEDPTSQ